MQLARGFFGDRPLTVTRCRRLDDRWRQADPLGRKSTGAPTARRGEIGADKICLLTGSTKHPKDAKISPSRPRECSSKVPSTGNMAPPQCGAFVLGEGLLSHLTLAFRGFQHSLERTLQNVIPAAYFYGRDLSQARSLTRNPHGDSKAPSRFFERECAAFGLSYVFSPFWSESVSF